jgi:hypothetical protein
MGCDVAGALIGENVYYRCKKGGLVLYCVGRVWMCSKCFSRDGPRYVLCLREPFHWRQYLLQFSRLRAHASSSATAGLADLCNEHDIPHVTITFGNRLAVVKQRPRRFAGWPAHICTTQPCRPAYRETHSSATHRLHEKCLSRLGLGALITSCKRAPLRRQVLSWRTEIYLL